MGDPRPEAEEAESARTGVAVEQEAEREAAPVVNRVEKYELLLIALITGLLGWFCVKIDQVDDKVESGVRDLTKQLVETNSKIVEADHKVELQRVDFTNKIEGRLDDLSRAVAEAKKSQRLR